MNIKRQYSYLKAMLFNLAKKEVKVFVALFIVIFGTWIFIEISDEVIEGSTQDFDEMVLTTLRQGETYEIPRGPEWLESSVRDITSLGGGTILILLTFTVFGYLLLQKNYKMAFLFFFAIAGGALIGFYLKDVIARERPTIVLQLYPASNPSFPSGHSMMSVVFYLTLGALLARIQQRRIIRIYIISISLFLALLIGLSRIYIGVHYPTDVLGGWSIGLAWASLCWFLAWLLQRKEKFKEMEEG